jgi:hypothetical protein
MQFHTHFDVFVSVPLACGLAISYVVLTLAGQWFMTPRARLHLSGLKISYNIAQIIACVTTFWRLLPFFTTAEHSYGVGIAANQIVEWWVWSYYCCKIMGLCDTVFIVLEKKTHQLSFLHVFQQASIVPLFAYYLNAGMGGGCVGVLPLWNSFVHIGMYSHYLFRCLAPAHKAWWKPVLTGAQISHHALIMTYMMLNYFFGDPTEITTSVAVFGMLWGLTIMFLFAVFFAKQYKYSCHDLATNVLYFAFGLLMAVGTHTIVNMDALTVDSLLQLPFMSLLPLCLVPWMSIMLIVWISPISSEFKQKHADCILCSCHSLVSSGFGIAVWTLERPQCRLPHFETHWIRFVMILSLAFFCTDFAWMLVANVWKRWGNVDAGILVHHCLIGFIFIFALRTNIGMWFVTSLLVNELSSFPLSVVFILRYLERQQNMDYYLVGIVLVICFFFCRIVMIPYCVWCFWSLDLCQDVFGKTLSQTILVFFAIIYAMNCYWFSKLASKALRSAVVLSESLLKSLTSTPSQ